MSAISGGRSCSVEAPSVLPLRKGTRIANAPLPAPSPVQVQVNVGTPVVVTAGGGPPFVVRALWYVFVGWWLSALVIVLGYALTATIVGIPMAFALFNRIPQLLTLRARTVR
ncbi:MAG: hypothetical protein M3P34_01585 [Actinomycetota bacterium]|nr:hypothetical protein [Actinomycetota bacterium]